MKTSTTHLAKQFIRLLLALAFWLAVWQIAASYVGKDLILPSPLIVAQTLFRLSTDRDFWLITGASLIRIALGFIVGIIIGVFLAILTEASRLAEMLLSPAIRIIRATPVASFIILVLLWVTRSLVPAVMSSLMVIPIVWAEMSTAISETDKSLLEMANAYRFGRLKTLRLVYIPSLMPQFISACLTSQGLSWKSGIAAEVLCLPALAIGSKLYHSKIYLETPSLFAWTAVVILISFIIEKLCNLAFHSIKLPKAMLSPSGTAAHAAVAPYCGMVLEDIHLSYGDKRILDNFSLSIPSNGVTCITGPSGCGKTSLLRVIAGLTKVQSGSISQSPELIGVMFQEDRLLPWLSAGENIEAVSNRNTAQAWLEKMGMPDDFDTIPSQLSGGMSRRVALARALAYSTDLLLLDEPFSGLDVILTASCADLIKNLDIPIIAVTHSAEEIELLGGHILQFPGPSLSTE